MTVSGGTVNGVEAVGGLLGEVEAGSTPISISQVSSSATVNANANSNLPGQIPEDVGGLIGSVSGNSLVTISNSNSSGSVNSPSTFTSAVGGLIGTTYDDVTVQNSYSTGTVTAGTSDGIGGLIGNASGVTTIDQDFSTGLVQGGVSTDNPAGGVGGLVGILSNSNVTDSYSNSFVQGDTEVGGLIGQASSSIIANTFSTGGVQANAIVGGYVGAIDAFTAANITNSFWNTDTVNSFMDNETVQTAGGTYTGVATNAPSSLTGVTPADTATLQSEATFSGFDFTNTWGILEGESYPYLSTIYTSAPSVISGSLDAPYGDTINLALNGVAVPTSALSIGSANIGADGSFYFLEGNGISTENSYVLLYAGAAGGDIVSKTPSDSTSLTGLQGIGGELSLSSGSDTTTPVTFSNAFLGAAKGLLTDPDILYSVTGTDLTLGNATNPSIFLITMSGNLTYDLDGAVNPAAGGSVNMEFNGPLNLMQNDAEITGISSIFFNSSVSGDNLILTAGAEGGATFNFGSSSTVALNDLTMTASSGADFEFTPASGSLHDITMTAATGGSTFNFSPTSITMNNLTMTSGGESSSTFNFAPTSSTLNNLVMSDTGDTVSDAFTLTDGATLNSISIIGSNITNGGGGAFAGNNDNGIDLKTGSSTTWNITSANGGSVSGFSGASFTFSNVGNIEVDALGGGGGGGFGGGPGMDPDFIFTTGSLNQITGTQGIVDTLDFSHFNTALNIILNESNSLDVSGTSNAGVANFSNITNIIGNSALSNTLTAAGENNTWTISGLNSGGLAMVGTGPGGGGTVSQNNGGGQGQGGGDVTVTNTDTFQLSGGTLTGSITGGGGTNTIIGDNVVNNFVIDGANSGTMTGVDGGFSNIQNLTGGSQNNTFAFTGSGSLSGTASGGNTTAVNTLDYSQSNSAGTINVVFGNNSTSGSVFGSGQQLINLFSNITNINLTPVSVSSSSSPPLAEVLTRPSTLANSTSPFDSLDVGTFFAGENIVISSVSPWNTPAFYQATPAQQITQNLFQYKSISQQIESLFDAEISQDQSSADITIK